MTATYCLGAFAVELRQTDRSQWGVLVKAQPIDCPMGCDGPGCHAVCRDYARMQWRIGEKFKEKAA
jgi:hypothetical protein